MEKQEEIVELIGRSIREGKMLSISYGNKKGATTSFWIGITDVIGPMNSEKANLKALYFNVAKDNCDKRVEKTLVFSSIKSAELLEGVQYDVPPKLLNKLQKNSSEVSWIKYERFNNDILNYYLECSKLDNDPYQKCGFMIPGVDLDSLFEEKTIKLSEEQVRRVASKTEEELGIETFGKIMKEGRDVHLVLTDCAIEKQNKKKYVICYYNVYFNPIANTLTLDNERQYNPTFLWDGKDKESATLFALISCTLEDFKNIYENDRKAGLQLVREAVRNRPYLYVNDRPELTFLARDVKAQLEPTYRNINKEFQEGTAAYPIRAFFGDISRGIYNHNRREPLLVLADSQANVDQVRALYDSLRYPVTYVKGPPGTGKTQILTNLVLSCLVNHKSLLICSSNNKPVDGMLERLNLECNGQKIIFPCLRLGNNEVMKAALAQIKRFYEMSFPKPDDLSKYFEEDNPDTKNLRKLISDYEIRLSLIENKNSLQKLIDACGDKDDGRLKDSMDRLNAQIEAIPEVTDDKLKNLYIPLNRSERMTHYLQAESIKCLEKLKRPEFKKLIDICNLEGAKQVNEFNWWLMNSTVVGDRSYSNLRLLTAVFPVIYCTNFSCSKLGNGSFKFDLVAMDEAGQAQVAVALLSVSRAKSLLLLGDESQLKPVIVLDSQTDKKLRLKYDVSAGYSYSDNSILSIMRRQDRLSKFVFLRDHYRCSKSIIQFANQRFYHGQIDIKTADFPNSLQFIDVNNRNTYRDGGNQCIDEARAIVDYVKKNDLGSTFILTPFVNQAALINDLLSRNNIHKVRAGTVHSMQGAETDTVIFSTAISENTRPGTMRWLKNNHDITNVAVTRAKKRFVMVADKKALKDLSLRINRGNKDEKNDLLYLAEYVLKKGKIIVPEDKSYAVSIGYSNNSFVENEFFETMKQLCTVYRDYIVKRNVSVASLFSDCPDLANCRYEFDEVLFNRGKPYFAIEIDGPEHVCDEKTAARDRLKDKLCRERGIRLYRVPRSMMKDYEALKDTVFSRTKGGGTFAKAAPADSTHTKERPNKILNFIEALRKKFHI